LIQRYLEFEAVKGMILKNKYPICEFDTGKNPIIQPEEMLLVLICHSVLNLL